MSCIQPSLMKRIVQPFVCLCFLASPTLMRAGDAEIANAPALALKAEIERLSQQQQNVVGVVVTHLESGRSVTFNGDISFPMASTYKIAMAAYGLSQVDAGTLSLDQLVSLEESQRVVSSVLNQYLPYPGVAVSLQNLLFLMMTESDNTATDLFLETIGGAAAVTAWLKRNGIDPMRVDRSTAQILRQYAGLPEPQPGESYFEQYETALAQQKLTTFALDGGSEPYKAFEQDPQDQATPLAMNHLMMRLWQGELLSAASTDLLKDIMFRCNTGSERLKGLLPTGTPVAHKTGTITGTLNDVGVVTLPGDKGQLVMTVFVKNAIGPWAGHERVIAEIARAAFDYFMFTHAAED